MSPIVYSTHGHTFSTDEKYDRVWLVDCGDIDKVIKKIGKKSVEGVLLTHAHSDHIYGLEELIER